MSTTVKRLRTNEWGDPIVTIVIDGHTDIYRLARHMENGQVEFGAMGRQMLRSLDRWRPGTVRVLTASMGTGRRRAADPAPPQEPGT